MTPIISIHFDYLMDVGIWEAWYEGSFVVGQGKTPAEALESLREKEDRFSK
jgi:hypothetical protein